MEIDIFPLPSTKGVNRYIGPAFLGLIIITYIVGAYKVAQQLVGADKELLCFLVTIPIFIGGYAVLDSYRHILTLVTIKCDDLRWHFICQVQTYGFKNPICLPSHMLFLYDSNHMKKFVLSVAVLYFLVDLA